MLTIDGAQAGTQTKNYLIKFHWKRLCAVVLQLNFTTYLLFGVTYAYCSTYSRSLSLSNFVIAAFATNREKTIKRE